MLMYGLHPHNCTKVNHLLYNGGTLWFKLNIIFELSWTFAINCLCVSNDIYELIVGWRMAWVYTLWDGAYKKWCIDLTIDGAIKEDTLIREIRGMWLVQRETYINVDNLRSCQGLGFHLLLWYAIVCYFLHLYIH